MKICTYARVSKKMAADERGTSLIDQENRFLRFLERTGNERVDSLAEEVSGGNNTRTPRFTAMLERMPLLGVQALVVDKIDRFTRDAIDGPAMIAKLRDMGVALWEVRKEKPFDLRSDVDRNDVLNKFRTAENERAMIRERQLYRYEEQRERGAATVNRPAFGLRLSGERKGHRIVVGDPDTAPIVQEVDRMVLNGASQRTVLAYLAPMGLKGIWTSRRGLALALRNEAYVEAGVRSAETQRRLRELFFGNVQKQSYGPDRNTTQSFRQHEFSGLIACGQCVTAGYDSNAARMTSRYMTMNLNPQTLVCSGVRSGVTVHKPIMISLHFVLAPLMDCFNKLRDRNVAEAVLERWKQEPLTDNFAKMRISLESTLALTDTEEAAIESRVDAALRLMESGRAGVVAEAERVLDRANTDRLTLRAKQAALKQRLSDLPLPMRREIHVGSLLFDAENLLTRPGMRDALKKWVDAIGPPVWYGRKQRKQGRRLDSLSDLRWPFIDAIRAKPAPNFVYDPVLDAIEANAADDLMLR